jgi:hypothetical protein
MYATTALMAKGATVFGNTGCDGKTDLCFKYKGSIYEIDVKLARYTQTKPGHYYWMSSEVSQVKLPVYPLIVVPATGANLSGWYCKWKQTRKGSNHIAKSYHCPPGLENFWD